MARITTRSLFELARNYENEKFTRSNSDQVVCEEKDFDSLPSTQERNLSSQGTAEIDWTAAERNKTNDIPFDKKHPIKPLFKPVFKRPPKLFEKPLSKESKKETRTEQILTSSQNDLDINTLSNSSGDVDLRPSNYLIRASLKTKLPPKPIETDASEEPLFTTKRAPLESTICPKTKTASKPKSSCKKDPPTTIKSKFKQLCQGNNNQTFKNARPFLKINFLHYILRRKMC